MVGYLFIYIFYFYYIAVRTMYIYRRLIRSERNYIYIRMYDSIVCIYVYTHASSASRPPTGRTNDYTSPSLALTNGSTFGEFNYYYCIYHNYSIFNIYIIITRARTFKEKHVHTSGPLWDLSRRRIAGMKPTMQYASTFRREAFLGAPSKFLRRPHL